MEQATAVGEDLVVQVVDDGQDFAGLAGEWDRLYQAASRATPFQSHGWLNAWWRAYGRPGRLRVVVVRDGGNGLVAAAPLHLERRWGLRVLTPLGGAISDFTDVLVAERSLSPEGVTAVTAALADGIRSLRGWDAVDLPEVRPGGAAELLFERWAGPRWSFAASTCMEVLASDFDELVAGLSKKRAGELRRRLRRADELGITLTDASAEEVEETVTQLLRLHEEQWEGRGVTPEHVRPRFKQHLIEALTVMVGQNQAALTRFTLDGEVVSVKLVLHGHDMLGGYLAGVAPSLRKKIDYFTYVMRDDVNRTGALGLSTYNMLRGRESYKDRWHPVIRVNRRLVLGRAGSPSGYPLALGLRARAVAVQLVKDRAPWAQERLQRLAALRPGR